MSFVNQVIGLAREYKKNAKRAIRDPKYYASSLNGKDWLHEFSSDIPKYFRKQDVELLVHALVQLCKNSTPAYKPTKKRVRITRDMHLLNERYGCNSCGEHFTVTHPWRPGLLHCPKCTPCPYCKSSTLKMAATP